jgi:hypothetical protein
MAETRDQLLDLYFRHLDVQTRSTQKVLSEDDEEILVLPDEVATFCKHEPTAGLELILRALEAAKSPEVVAAIGRGLLENLLNATTEIRFEVATELMNNKKFRQAFAHGEYASVHPEIVAEWVAIFQGLGTTKEAERKSLWQGAA